MQREFESMLIVLVCVVLGIVMAMMIKTLNDEGIIVNLLVTGTITLEHLMFIVFFMWLLVGILLAVTRK